MTKKQICGKNFEDLGPTPNITAELSRLKKKLYPFGFASTSKPLRQADSLNSSFVILLCGEFGVGE